MLFVRMSLCNLLNSIPASRLRLPSSRTLYIQGERKLDFLGWVGAIQKAAGSSGDTLSEQQLTDMDVPIVVDRCVDYITQCGRWEWERWEAVSFARFSSLSKEKSSSIAQLHPRLPGPRMPKFNLEPRKLRRAVRVEAQVFLAGSPGLKIRSGSPGLSTQQTSEAQPRAQVWLTEVKVVVMPTSRHKDWIRP